MERVNTWIFSTSFRKTLISSFIKIRPVAAEFFRVDKQTDMTKLIVAFRNFSINNRFSQYFERA